jgi:hypothetical protein
MDPRVRELIDLYRQAAIGHGTAVENGDSRKANQHYQELQDARAELYSMTELALPALRALLDDPDLHVQLCAARDNLNADPDAAEATLVRLARRDDILGFNAEMLLSEWKRGNIPGMAS